MGEHLTRLAWRARTALPGRFIRSAFGPRLLKRPGDLTFGFSLEGPGGAYGPLLADLIAGYDQDFVFLDIGANQGIFTLLAARQARCRRVIAIEPVPATFAALVENIVANGIEAQVTALCGAVAATEVPAVRLSYNPRHSGGSQLAAAGQGDGVLAPVVSARLLDAALPADLAGAVLVKIDVEGAEGEVLEVLQATGFFPRIRDFVIEVSSRMARWEENVARIYQVMDETGFTEVTQRPDLGQPFHYDAHFRRA